VTRTWLFRVASHSSQGGGHVARSGVLARELARIAPVRMVLDPDSPDARARLEGAGVICVTAGDEGQGPWAGAVVDGYAFRESEATRIAQRTRPLVWLDDFLDPPDGADLVINAACHLSGIEVRGTPALLGPKYAIIDRRFAELPGRDRTLPVEKLLVAFGRLDPDNAVCGTLDALDLLAKEGISPLVTVVTSTASSHLPAVRERIARSSGRVTLMIDVPDMVPVLAEADLVIGAGGVSLMERLAAGVPSISLVIADNQKHFIESAAANGGTVHVGTADKLPPSELATIVRELIADPTRRAGMAETGRHLIDGLGAARVADALMTLSESIHKANAGRCEICH
jgi:UDP-2,4-diacetamido-2,4,6-trideoxy-beta-L-altropyranose hydrolase